MKNTKEENSSSQGYCGQWSGFTHTSGLTSPFDVLQRVLANLSLPLQSLHYLTPAWTAKYGSVGIFYNPTFSVLTERIKDYTAAGVSVEEKMIQNSFFQRKKKE